MDAPALPLEDTLRQLVEERTPHNQMLGLKLLAIGPGQATCRLPNSQGRLDDPGAGALLALADVACGASICARLGRMPIMATMSLRIDSLRARTAGRSLTAQAECYDIAGPLAFVRASIHEGEETALVAAAQGSFMIMEE